MTRTATVLLLALAAPTLAAAPDPPTAAELFERSLAAEGLDAAVARLQAALADTTEPHAVDAYELAIALPNRLVLRHEREAALALVAALEPLFGDDPRYWQVLGQAHLRCGQAAEARAALTRAQARGARPDLSWMVERIDALAALARTKAACEDSLVPGAATGLDGPYLGQPPPGAAAEVFAAGYVSTNAHEYHVSIAPDGRTILFSRGGVGTLVTRWTEDGWTVPEVVHLIDEDHLTEEANLTPDGRAVVFCGRGGVRAPRVLYRAERDGDRWGAPVELFPGMYATATLDGTLYYTVEGEGRDYGAIVSRRRTAEGYGPPEPVPGEGINSPAPDAHPWIAPDGSMLVFDSYREPGTGLHAAFRHPDGRWGRAVALQERLGLPPVGQPALSPDLKYLFFCLAGDLYWVDAGFLDEVRRESLRE